MGEDRSRRAGRPNPSGGSMTEGADLAAALAGLARASRHRLAEQWVEYFGPPPPPRTSRSLLLRAVSSIPRSAVVSGEFLARETAHLFAGAVVRVETRALQPGLETGWRRSCKVEAIGVH